MWNAERKTDEDIISPPDQAIIDRVLETIWTTPINPDIVKILWPGHIDWDWNPVFQQVLDETALKRLIDRVANENFE